MNKEFIIIYIPFLVLISASALSIRPIISTYKAKSVKKAFAKGKTTINLLNSLAEKLGKGPGRGIISLYEKKVPVFKKFLNAGQNEKNNINIFSLIGYKMLTAACLSLMSFFLASSVSGIILFFFILAITGFFIPDIIIRSLISKNMALIKEEIPYISDLLYISTLSGQNIYKSLKTVASKKGSISAGYIKRLIGYLDSGLDGDASYMAVTQGCYSKDLKNLFSVIFQAQRHGSRLSDILLENSRFLRFEIEQQSEKKARRSSVLILFPLVFFILPAFIFLIGGPFIISVAKGLFVF